MAKITLPPITSVTNVESFLAALEEWRNELQDWSDLVLSRNGQTPNTMAANLDMNSFRILNMAAPVDDNDPVRRIDVIEGIQGEPGEQGPPGGPIADGDYGDIVATVGGTVLTIDSALLPAYGRTLVANTSAADARSDLGLGGAAVLSVGTSAGTVASGNDSRFTDITIRNFSGATDAYVLTDQMLRYTGSGAATVTLPAHGTVAFNDGKVLFLRVPNGTGTVTVERAVGVDLVLNGSTTSADIDVAEGGFVQIVQDATNGWIMTGSGATEV